MRARQVLLAIGCAIPVVTAAQTVRFESYYPNRVDRTLVFEYTTAVEGEVQQSHEGFLTRSPAGPETRNGRRYDVVEHTTEGLPEPYPERWKSYHRETEKGLYTGQANTAGIIEEYLELPASAEPGEPWGASAFWASQTVAVVPRVETPAGIFENCMRVTRLREDPPSGQTLRNATTYCPGVSAVRSSVEHTAPDLRSVTRFRLVAIRR